MADVNDLQSFRSNVTQAEKCEAVEWLADQNNKYARILHWELVRLNFDEGRCDADGFPITQPPTDQPAAGVDADKLKHTIRTALYWLNAEHKKQAADILRNAVHSFDGPHSVPCAAQETPDDDILKLLRKAEFSDKQYSALVITRWKDGIDVDYPTEALKKLVALIRELSALRSTESVIRPEPLRLNDMTHVGELFSLRMVDGCSHGCAELYVEDDEYYHLKARFDRYWLDDLAFVIRKALESTHPADSNKEGV